jgi:hypothetical protein
MVLSARSRISDRSICRGIARRRRTIERRGCDCVWVRINRGCGSSFAVLELLRATSCVLARVSQLLCAFMGTAIGSRKGRQEMSLRLNGTFRIRAEVRKTKICSEKSRDNLAELSDVVRYEHQPNRRADSVRYSRSQEACLGGWS